MNVLEEAIKAIAPQYALKRARAKWQLHAAEKILASGYSAGGASYTKKALKGMVDYSSSPQLDIDANLRTLTNRSRILYMTSPMAASALKTLRTNVVGSGLRLKCRVDAQLLGLSEEEADTWESAVEREFALWADTRKCDALRLNSFYEMQGLIFLGQIMNGDGFCLLKFGQPTPHMPYGLRLQLVESDRVCTPYAVALPMGGSYQPFWGQNPDNGNEIYSGVEIDKNGATVAYWICNQYPYTMTGYTFEPPAWKRVPACGAKTGRPNLIHLFDAERAEQRRGVPILSPVIEELQQIKRYEEAELMAAVITSCFTVFVKTQGLSTDNPFGASNPLGTEPVAQNDNEYQMGMGSVVILQPGEEIEVADPKRPSSGFDAFVIAVARSIGAAMEIPYEVLLKMFNSSYSASRAALLEFWKVVRMRREWLANEFCQPVYEQFLAEAVARGRIQAPGFFENPIIRKVWCRADWNGPAQGTLDPVKEVQAAKMRVENGFSTREEETIGLTGGDFKQNARQLKRENEILQEAQERKLT